MKEFNNKLNKLFLFSSLLAYASLGKLAVKADGPNLSSTAASCGSVFLAETGGNLGRNTQNNNYITDGTLLGQCIDDLSTNQGFIDTWGESKISFLFPLMILKCCDIGTIVSFFNQITEPETRFKNIFKNSKLDFFKVEVDIPNYVDYLSSNESKYY